MKLRTLLTLIAAFAVLAPNAAFAIDLSTAKSQGLVGERHDGLIGPVTPPGSGEVQALVAQTNAGRLDLYKKQAQQEGVTLDQYQAVAGSNLIQRTPSGQYVNTGGGWTKK
jgi:uncharacterized protein YdbL (DUF1318 family)